MRVLMLSIDKTLLGEQARDRYGFQGDTIERHEKYGELVDKLDIIVTSAPGFDHLQLSEKVDVYPTNSEGPIGHLRSVMKLAADLAKDPGFDLVVAQDLTAPAALKIKKKFGIPYLVTTHGVSWDNPDIQGGLKRKIELWLVKKAMRQADGLRVVSPGVKVFYKTQCITCLIEVIPTPQDYSIFFPVKQGKSLGESVVKKEQTNGVILTDGRLEKVKNYPLLFEAFVLIKKQLPEAKLQIIGIGSLGEELKVLVEKMNLKISVEFLGSMPYEKLPAYYQACDVFVLASDSESLGKVLLQAGAAGKPVVATKTIGAKSIVKNSQNGFLADIGSAQQLAEKIVKLLEDKSLREEMGALGQKNVSENYNAEDNIKKFIDFWKEIEGNAKNYNTAAD